MEVKCAVTKTLTGTRLNVPDGLFKLCVSASIVYEKDPAKGAVIRMRVPEIAVFLFVLGEKIC
ncbi:MAG TPA: hypothetical protein P5511_01660 [Candidatus Goldiibacteriota bacterium]|nr:hypothetical protein [Candidatus Goldiibacteriota bacterium]